MPEVCTDSVIHVSCTKPSASSPKPSNPLSYCMGLLENPRNYIWARNYSGRVDYDEVNLALRELELPVPSKNSRCAFTPEIFKKFFIADRPTVGIISLQSGIIDEARLAIYSAYRRAQGLWTPNFVILSPGLPGSIEYYRRDGDSVGKVLAREGQCIDLDGRVYQGRFKKPIRIDYIVGSSWHVGLGDAFSACDVPQFCSREFELTTKNKALCKQIASSVGIRVPSAEYIEVGDKNYQQRVEKFVAASRSGIVVKPDFQNRGTGVLILPKPTIQDVLAHVQRLLELNMPVLVEDLVQSAPLKDRNTDWNIRAIFAGPEFVGAGIRSGPAGHPINIALGGNWHALDKLPELLASPLNFDLKKICAEIRQIGNTLYGHLGGEYMGLDLIVDQQARVWLIETNGECSGGLDSLLESCTSAAERSSLVEPVLKRIDILAKQAKERMQGLPTADRKLIYEPISPFYADRISVALASKAKDDPKIDLDQVIDFDLATTTSLPLSLRFYSFRFLFTELWRRNCQEKAAELFERGNFTEESLLYEPDWAVYMLRSLKKYQEANIILRKALKNFNRYSDDTLDFLGHSAADNCSIAFCRRIYPKFKARYPDSDATKSLAERLSPSASS